jgi:methylated-DNA-[protein]-cysteine S-methyltransferase
VSESDDPIGELLRRHGLRSTPQRRAILTAVDQSGGEHLSADEVHARASQSLPDLGRGTVYATLTELSELGALGAVGLPEPVRYEANTTPHAHFRCRLCMRLFDLDSDLSQLDRLVDERFAVERVTMRAEGICADCRSYEAGLLAGVRAIHGRGRTPWSGLVERSDLACTVLDGPLGTLILAATPTGLARLAFAEHGDAAELRERAASRRGSLAARAHLSAARAGLASFLAGSARTIECAVDPGVLGSAEAALRATRSIDYGSHSSYSKLGLRSGEAAAAMPPRDLGAWLGANPIPIVFPCHRVSRGKEVPHSYVGGLERRQWLEGHEREHA